MTRTKYVNIKFGKITLRRKTWRVVEREQKNNNLSYCNGFQKCNKSCTWYGSFGLKKVILKSQEVFWNKIVTKIGSYHHGWQRSLYQRSMFKYTYNFKWSWTHKINLDSSNLNKSPFNTSYTPIIKEVFYIWMHFITCFKINLLPC